MARTRQSARMLPGGKAPRMQLATKAIRKTQEQILSYQNYKKEQTNPINEASEECLEKVKELCEEITILCKEVNCSIEAYKIQLADIYLKTQNVEKNKYGSI